MRVDTVSPKDEEVGNVDYTDLDTLVPQNSSSSNDFEGDFYTATHKNHIRVNASIRRELFPN